MKQLSLTAARAKLSTLVAEVDRGKGPIAIAQHVTDTHPLVFWSANRKSRLGKRARRILQETEQGKHSLVVPVVVLEEINRLIEKSIVRLQVPFRRWAAELERSPNFQIQAYTLEVLLESVSLVAIRDPADRAIVATARHFRCPLTPPMKLFVRAIGSIRLGNEDGLLPLATRGKRMLLFACI
jgi:PIN domain nuclease of toxin-antitoxin system